MPFASDEPSVAPRRRWLFIAVALGAVPLALIAWAAWQGGGAAPGDTAATPWIFVALALWLATLAAFGAGALLGRQRRQRALHEARMQCALLAQLLDVWQWQTDRHHRLRRMQPPAGAPSASWLGGDWGGRPLWEHFDAAAGLRAQLESMAPLSDLPVRGVTTEGDAAWLLRAVPCFDAEGQFAGHVGTARQAAAGAQAGAALLPTAAAASGDSGELLSEQAAFSYTVTHDLRAPIRVVEGFTRILKEDYGRLLDRVGNDHLDRVLAAAARMNSMIDALLTLANLSAQPLARQPVNLSQIAGFVIDDLRRASPERQVEVRLQPGMVAEGDPTLLRLVLDNLLGNAWKYSARNPHARLAFGSEQRDGRTVYCVSDNGAGFDMRNADRLFGVFQRLHSANDFPGTGVGLASVKRIVRRHGGDVWAESEPGRGARFQFTLQP